MRHRSWPSGLSFQHFSLSACQLFPSLLTTGYRPGIARPTTSPIAFAALLLDYAQKLWPAIECIGWLSPFRYFTPFELVMGDPLPVENLLVLGAIAMTGFTLAYFTISHRDISR